jgi:hypothetical protein
MPDEIGEELGWRPVDEDTDAAGDAPALKPQTAEQPQAAPRHRT